MKKCASDERFTVLPKQNCLWLSFAPNIDTLNSRSGPGIKNNNLSGHADTAAFDYLPTVAITDRISLIFCWDFLWRAIAYSRLQQTFYSVPKLPQTLLE